MPGHLGRTTVLHFIAVLSHSFTFLEKEINIAAFCNLDIAPRYIVTLTIF